MKITKEIDKNLALFEVTRRNCAATEVGDIVEFFSFGEYQGRIDFTVLMCAQIEDRQHVDYPQQEGCFYEAGTAWFYDKSSVRPLTKLAEKLLKDSVQAQKERADAERFAIRAL